MDKKSVDKLSKGNPNEVAKIARDKVERRFSLLKHFLVFVVINGLFLGVDHYLTTKGDWSYIPLFVWGAGLFAHGLTVVFGDFLSDWKEKVVEQEVRKVQGE